MVLKGARDKYWGGCITQVPLEQHQTGIDVAEMSPELLEFVRDAFGNSQIPWFIVDTEAFAVVNSSKRLKYTVGQVCRVL